MLAQTCWLQSVVDGHCEASLSHSAPANKKKKHNQLPKHQQLPSVMDIIIFSY
jgi:hypothetical protein